MDGNFVRGAGVLCHISSLPNKYGIGSLGKEAYDFAEFLKKSHVKYWQILPPVQTNYGDSPYQSVCCNSGNPYFIDLEALRDEGLLDDEELQSAQMPEGDIDYAGLYERRYNVLRLAYARFNLKDKEFAAFMQKGEFEDYALFMSLKTRFGGTFDKFPDAYKFKERLAIEEFRNSVYKSEYCFWQFLQFIFEKQWKRLKEYVNSLGIKIIGDIPLYVAYDSSDVWGHPELFRLDENLKPTAVAGVPPDYFSEKGQLWGNPLYNWDLMSAQNYEWWIKRIDKAAHMYDVIRIDHFRGLDRYYAIPAGNETAEVGEWLPGPGMRLFHEIRRRVGDVNIIAEDLGVMDSGVVKLRQRSGFPGMKILQFAFDGEKDNAYLPENFEENSVVYTGTHDNDTTLGFINKMDEEEFKTFKKRLREALGKEGVQFPFVTPEETVTALNICALASKARLAVIPVQDMLALDTEARMNIPSIPDGNWRFRLDKMPSRISSAIMRKTVDKYKR
ncbi:MAG: 4-alpha-glucanotransferase [Clostridia bacterium]|nr:4-alpha-glucanotransferase [Clostridia bacterium]